MREHEQFSHRCSLATLTQRMIVVDGEERARPRLNPELAMLSMSALPHRLPMERIFDSARREETCVAGGRGVSRGKGSMKQRQKPEQRQEQEHEAAAKQCGSGCELGVNM
eukprot:1133187-Prymnesium_polylepis.1